MFFQEPSLVVGVSATVAATALAGRYLIGAWQARPRARRFYPGGFQPVMTRREAALILGVRLNIHFSYSFSSSHFHKKLYFPKAYIIKTILISQKLSVVYIWERAPFQFSYTALYIP